jgi:hypothetical protein
MADHDLRNVYQLGTEGETPIFIMSRYLQPIPIHDALTDFFFTEAGIENITAYVRNPIITTLNELPNAVDANIFQYLIRFASFHVIIQGDIITISVVHTVPRNDDTYMVDLLNDPNVDAHFQDGNIFSLFYSKIISEIQSMGGGHDGSYIVSYEIYYHRQNVQAGHFHRDLTDVEDPLYVSLEYFIGGVLLGPELLRFIPGLDRRDDRDVITLVETGERSSRVLVTNGSIIVLNNHRTIHATPITGPYILNVPGNNQGIFIGSVFHGQPGRLEQNPAPEARAIVLNTRDNRRSFIRGWWVLLPEHNLVPLGRLITGPVIPAQGSIPLEPRHIMGGTLTKLPNFKLYSNYIKINDVPLQEIPVDKIDDYIKKETLFIKNINQKIGGKKRTKRIKKKNRRSRYRK